MFASQAGRWLRHGLLASVLCTLLSACIAGAGTSTTPSGPTVGGGGVGATPAPTIVVSGLAAPGNLIVEAATRGLYWIDYNAGTVWYAPALGGQSLTIAAFGDGSVPLDITQDATSIYVSYGFNAPGKILKNGKPFVAGTSSTLLASAPGATWAPCLGANAPSLCGIVPGGVVFSTYQPGLYYAESYGGGVGTLSTLVATNGNVSTVYPGASSGKGPLYWLAADSGGLYLAPDGGASSTSTIRYVGYSGGQLGTAGPFGGLHGLVTAQPNGIGVGSVFFIEASSGKLYQVQVAGGTGPFTKVLATNAGAPSAQRALAVDNNCVYYVTQGQIARLDIQTPSGGGGPFTPKILVNAADAANPASVAVDDTYVYWTASGNGNGNGSVRSILKPTTVPCAP